MSTVGPTERPPKARVVALSRDRLHLPRQLENPLSYVSNHDEWSNKRAEPNGNRPWKALIPRFETGPFLVQELTNA